MRTFHPVVAVQYPLVLKLLLLRLNQKQIIFNHFSYDKNPILAELASKNSEKYFLQAVMTLKGGLLPTCHTRHNQSKFLQWLGEGSVH